MIRRMIPIALALPLLLAVSAVEAQNARQAREQMEMSLLVRGHADIDREGLVTAHELEHPDKLPGFVVDLVAEAVPRLRFEPLLAEGGPVLARAKMTLRVVAQPEGDEMRLSIRSAHFGDAAAVPDDERVTSVDMRPPRYPGESLRMGGKGTVYLLVKVGRDGSVEDVVAEQTNLTAIGTARQMERIRADLERSSLSAAANWRFAPPVAGEDAGRPHWAIRVPVEYSLDGDATPAYGKWVAYHPGERAPRPEWGGRDPAGFSPDLLAAGSAHPADSRFRLLELPEG